ncbi:MULTISPECIES: hypothetical protein [Streptomyces]|uniref:hypothetical protein n=1 Tax=Streptomyces TaxID=1883 RepID=UPI002E7C2BF1|nr:hypothetical protein [Streptomyces huasconensis]
MLRADAGAVPAHSGADPGGRPFDAQGDGLVLGEGAGILILERACAARARRAPALADLLLAVPPPARGAREARVQDSTTAVTKKPAGQRGVKTVWSARTTGDTWLRSKDGRTLLVAVRLKGTDEEAAERAGRYRALAERLKRLATA